MTNQRFRLLVFIRSSLFLRNSLMRTLLILLLLSLGSVPVAQATLFAAFVEHRATTDEWDGKFPGKLYFTNTRGDGVCLSWAFRDESGKVLKGTNIPVLLPGGNKTVSVPGAGRDSRQLQIISFLPKDGHCRWKTNPPLNALTVGRNDSGTGPVVNIDRPRSNNQVGSFSIDATRWNGQDRPDITVTIR